MSSTRPAGVLHLIDSLDFGGAQTVVKNILEASPARDSTHLFALRATARRLSIAHPNVVVYPDTSRFSLRPLLAIADQIRRFDISIVHCHLFRSQVYGYLVARWLSGRRVQLVFHEHGSAVQLESGSLLERIAFSVFQRFAAPRVATYITISLFVKEALLRVLRGRRASVSVLYNPLRGLPAGRTDSTADRAEGARARIGVPDGHFVVGMAARIVRRKGWRDFLVALRVARRDAPTYFLIAGSGPESPQMAAVIDDESMRDHGRVLGYLEDLGDFYDALDCFVMPSHWQPSGLAHLEAQQRGVAVVAYDIPGLNETVHGGMDCLLCQPESPEELARAIVRLASDDALKRRIADAGRANASRFSSETYAKLLNGIYARLDDPGEPLVTETPRTHG